MKETFPCIKCGKITTLDTDFCCDGYECGCKGLPIHPPTCSKECDENFFGRGEKKIQKSLLKLERSLELTSNTMQRWKRQQLILITLINLSIISILIWLSIIYIFR